MTVYGIGIDSEDIERFQKRKLSFLQKIFTKKELAYCHKFACPAERLAARFCAKEAVFKAFGKRPDGLTFTTIEVLNDPRGKPVVHLRSKALRQKFNVLISLSHTRSQAYAFCMVLKKTFTHTRLCIPK